MLGICNLWLALLEKPRCRSRPLPTDDCLVLRQSFYFFDNKRVILVYVAFQRVDGTPPAQNSHIISVLPWCIPYCTKDNNFFLSHFFIVFKGSLYSVAVTEVAIPFLSRTRPLSPPTPKSHRIIIFFILS